MFRIFAILCVLATCWAQDCTVSNFKVMKNFDKQRYTGTWYFVAKKDEKDHVMHDNIVTEIGIEADGSMIGHVKGRIIMGHLKVCANIVVTLEDSPDPAKFKMTYSHQNRTDDLWIIDTDYDNYAVLYSCLQLDTDGTCLDSYSYISSRYSTGLRPEDEQIVEQKKKDICLLGKYRHAAHNGDCDGVN